MNKFAHRASPLVIDFEAIAEHIRWHEYQMCENEIFEKRVREAVVFLRIDSGLQ